MRLSHGRRKGTSTRIYYNVILLALGTTSSIGQVSKCRAELRTAYILFRRIELAVLIISSNVSQDEHYRSARYKDTASDWKTVKCFFTLV